MKPMLATAALAALVAGPVSLSVAQNHNLGWVVPAANGVHTVDAGGNVQSRTGSASYAAAMNFDNRTALVYDSTARAILQLDPVTLAVVGTFFQTPSFTSTTSVSDMVFDSNGDLFFSGTSGTVGIFKHTPGTATFSTVYGSTTFTGGVGSVSLHYDNGELLVTERLSSSNTLFGARRDGTMTTVIGTGLVTRYGTYQHIPSGDFYSGTCCGASGGGSNASVLVLRAGQTTATSLIDHPIFRGGYSPRPDRASAAQQRLVSSAWSNGTGGDGVWQIDIFGVTATKLATITSNTYKVVPIFGRNLQTVAAGRGQWGGQVSFPQHAGKSFVVGFSLRGLRPPTPLPDGRFLPLLPDPLTTLSVSGALSALIQNNVGVLNATGNAAFQLDLRPLGSGANGIVVYMVPVVLDPAAPFGIAVIGDPKPLVVEGI